MIAQDTPATIKEINAKLADVYGSDLEYRPNWRLVWSTSIIEKRFGEFEEWYNDIIFLRRTVGMRERPKYPIGTWGECWILERRWSSMNQERVDPPKDVWDWDGYEPFWSFKINLPNGKFEAIQPVWRAVNMIVSISLNGVKPTLSEMWDAEEKRWSDESKEIREMLDDDLPWRILQMKHGEGIVVPSNYKSTQGVSDGSA